MNFPRAVLLLLDRVIRHERESTSVEAGGNLRWDKMWGRTLK